MQLSEPGENFSQHIICSNAPEQLLLHADVVVGASLSLVQPKRAMDPTQLIPIETCFERRVDGAHAGSERLYEGARRHAKRRHCSEDSARTFESGRVEVFRYERSHCKEIIE